MGSAPRTTVELDPRLYRALKRRAAARKRSVSGLVNEAVRESRAAPRRNSRARGRRLSREDAADIAAIIERRHERGRPFDEFVKELKRDGLL
jgi:predicted transcriptional regulator